MSVDINSFNLNLVLLSYVMSVFGSFVALQLAVKIKKENKDSSIFWLVSSGLALGGGAVWSMHFIGMLAFKAPFSVGYDLTLTVLSLVTAVVVSIIGLALAGRRVFGAGGLFIGGAITGLGVSAMHYTGMAAMSMPATIVYNNNIVIVSVVIGVVAATVALWLAFNLDALWQRIVSAFVMGIAVCGMHYTGMYAVTMTMDEKWVGTQSAISSGGLAIGIFFFAISLLTILLFLTFTKSEVRAT